MPTSIRRVLLNEDHIQSLRIERMRFLMDAIHLSLQERVSMYVVFHPMSYPDTVDDWRFNSLTHWFTENDVDWISTSHLATVHNMEREVLIREGDGHPTTAYNRLVSEKFHAFIKAHGHLSQKDSPL